ncbi:MAG: efflux RND transporter periplasmic adaptor subunit [Caulobacteraceae bacterium]
MQFRFRRAAATLFVAMLAAGCGKHATQGGPPQPQVTVAHPLAEQVVDWDDYIGQFEAVQTVQVRPRVSGYLVGIHFRDGQLVKRGDVLFTIDPAPAQAALDQARAQAARSQATLVNAQAELARDQVLVASQAVSREEYESRQAAVRTAEADLKASQATVRSQALNLNFTRIVAPISGRISDRRVDIGNAVVADTTVLTTIVSVDPIHFSFEGSESLYLKYQRERLGMPHRGQPGDPVRIRLSDEPDYRWNGRIDFMDNAIDQSSGAIRGRAVVANPNGFLTPGMFGHMQMQGSHPYLGLLVPDTAVATQGGDRIAYVVGPDGAVAGRTVTLGPLSGGLRVIRSGLTANDMVVVDGQQRLLPGLKVKTQVTRITHPAGGGEMPTVSMPPAGAATPADVAG